MMKTFLIAAIFWFFTMAAYAAPNKAIHVPVIVDAPVKIYEFKEDARITIYGYLMHPTMIKLQPDERVMDHGILVGDTKSWQIDSGDGFLYVKLIATQLENKRPIPPVPFTMITNQRTYLFSLEMRPGTNGVTESANPVGFYQMIKFRFPEEEAKHIAELENQLHEAQSRVLNYSYEGCGPDYLLPVNAFDDGHRTYLIYSPSQRIPVFYRESDNPGGTPEIIQPEMRGNEAVFSFVIDKIRILRGADPQHPDMSIVACLRNKAFKP